MRNEEFDDDEFCEECQHSRSICESDDNGDCECLRDDGGYFAESDYGDGPGA